MGPVARAKVGRSEVETKAAAGTPAPAQPQARAVAVSAPMVESESMRSLYPGRPLAWVAGVALVLTVLWPLARVKVARMVPVPEQIDFFAREPRVQQATGFVALGLFALTLLLPLKRRLGRRLAGRREMWRLVHAGLGLALAGILLVHTGARLGRGGNLALSLATLGLVGLGAILGIAWRRTPPQRRLVGRGLRPLHLWLFWPTLGLVAVHVLAVYYF